MGFSEVMAYAPRVEFITHEEKNHIQTLMHVNCGVNAGSKDTLWLCGIVSPATLYTTIFMSSNYVLHSKAVPSFHSKR